MAAVSAAGTPHTQPSDPQTTHAAVRCFLWRDARELKACVDMVQLTERLVQVDALCDAGRWAESDDSTCLQLQFHVLECLDVEQDLA